MEKQAEEEKMKWINKQKEEKEKQDKILAEQKRIE